VLAAASGTVVLAGDQYYAGNSIFIDHGHELITMYFHLEELQVHSGQAVKRGQPIGTVGATGRATGAHLHFGARWHGARIDPELLLGTTPTLGNRKSGSERLARHPSDSL
jgi:murein DD-endopeptidase MepM/ murein hydrolase activator NlpD